MNTRCVFSFLRDIAEHNSREWFAENKSRYVVAREECERLVERAILVIGRFDPTILHLTAKDCLFRFYRDVRFSPDKSPYKRHFGAYICHKGRSSIHGGYYIHLQPGNSFLAAGAYCLPTPILTACRNEILGNIDVWRGAVENKKFVRLFGRAGGSTSGWEYDEHVAPRGFGFDYLKKCPKDFPADSPYVDYLRMKEYSCWRSVDDVFFEGDGWERPLADIFRTAKPMLDFINAVLDDYE